MVAQTLSIIVTEADYQTNLGLLSRHNVPRLSYIDLGIIKSAYFWCTMLNSRAESGGLRKLARRQINARRTPSSAAGKPSSGMRVTAGANPCAARKLSG
jgi:hypothetical protein